MKTALRFTTKCYLRYLLKYSMNTKKCPEYLQNYICFSELGNICCFIVFLYIDKLCCLSYNTPLIDCISAIYKIILFRVFELSQVVYRKLSRNAEKQLLLFFWLFALFFLLLKPLNKYGAPDVLKKNGTPLRNEVPLLKNIV